MTKLSVTVHDNNQVTLKDERGLPVVCKDCRFGGWLTQWEFEREEVPWTCLHHSGGADPRDGDRVVLEEIVSETQHEYACRKEQGWRLLYPRCRDKNGNGDCPDFVRAQPLQLRWWEQLLWGLPQVRQTARRRMRT